MWQRPCEGYGRVEGVLVHATQACSARCQVHAYPGIALLAPCAAPAVPDDPVGLGAAPAGRGRQAMSAAS